MYVCVLSVHVCVCVLHIIVREKKTKQKCITFFFKYL